MTTKERNAELIQKARDIVADIFVQMENAKTTKPAQFETVAAWAKHIEDYSAFMRAGENEAGEELLRRQTGAA